MILLCNCLPTHQEQTNLQIFLNIAQISLPILIAGILAYIAYQQYLLGQRKLRFDIFEKRCEYYQCYREMIKHILENKGISEDIFFIKYEKIMHYKFLFGNDVNDEVGRVILLGYDWFKITTNLISSIEKKAEDIYASEDYKNKILIKYNSLEDIFNTYLDFSKVRK